MGDVVSAHLDESRREMITAQTGQVLRDFSHIYKEQYPVALFNKIRCDIEGNGGPQSQLLHRKAPPEDKSIFSGSLFQYLEENKKWRNRFFFVPDSYNISYYESKQAHDRGLHPKGTICCAGYKVLTSMDKYVELLGSSLPGVKTKDGNTPFLKCATQFPLLLWHPYSRHFYFCVSTEKEQAKWHAVLQDCIRHTSDGFSEDCDVQSAAFCDSVRLYRQKQGNYSIWDMMVGSPAQILANLVMEKLVPELKSVIATRLKGKLQQRQKNWALILEAVYRQVQAQTQAEYNGLVHVCESSRPQLEASVRTDMDQIITSKEHVTRKLRASIMPKVEQLMKTNVQPYVPSILEELIEPSTRGFAEVRDVFFRELVDVSKNMMNNGTQEKLGEHMEKLSMLAYHPVKMQSCYEKMENLNLEGLHQRFDISSPDPFICRAQILMRKQMDDAVYTFEQILHQSLDNQEGNDLFKLIHRCQDRVIKKYDYDSSTVRKKFFKEVLLQIFVPHMLKHLSPSCEPKLGSFQELIFEDLSRFVLVNNIFEEVVQQTVSRDILTAVQELATQQRHNLYRDSMVLNISDPNLLMLDEKPPVDWSSGNGLQRDAKASGGEALKRRRQVVSMIQLDETHLPHVSCLEVPGVEDIPEEEAEQPLSPGSVQAIRSLINPKLEMVVPAGTNANGTVQNADEGGERLIRDAFEEAMKGVVAQPRRHDDSGFQSPANEAEEESHNAALESIGGAVEALSSEPDPISSV